MVRLLKIARTIIPFLAFILVGCSPSSGSSGAKPTPLAVSRFAGKCEIEATPNFWSSVLTNQSMQTGSSLRTGADSFVELKSASSAHRVVLAHESEAAIDRWHRSSPTDEEIRIDVRRGLVLIDLPAIGPNSKFELKGSNFAASVRAGPAVAAIAADGSVFVRSGTVVCVAIAPSVTAVAVNAGQMFDPAALISKPIPASSNQVWNLLDQ